MNQLFTPGGQSTGASASASVIFRVDFLHFLFYFIYFFILIFTLFCFTVLYWFCHTLTWISHGCTWVPNLEPPSHLPGHPFLTCCWLSKPFFPHIGKMKVTLDHAGHSLLKATHQGLGEVEIQLIPSIIQVSVLLKWGKARFLTQITLLLDAGDESKFYKTVWRPNKTCLWARSHLGAASVPLLMCYHCLSLKWGSEDFPGDPVVKNPPASPGDRGSIPGPGKFHMPRHN